MRVSPPNLTRPTFGSRRSNRGLRDTLLWLGVVATTPTIWAQTESALPEWPFEPNAARPVTRALESDPIDTIAVVGFRSPSQADPSPSGELRPAVQVDELLQLAFAQHPELEQEIAAIEREAGLRHQATRWPNPEVGYSASEIGQGGRAGQQGVFWSQEWVTAGKLTLADQVGQWRTVAAEAQLDVQRLRLSRRVQTQYWSLVAARKRVQLFSALEDVLSEAVRLNETLIQAAEIGRGTVLQARLEQRQISVAKRQAEIDLAARQQALAATLGMAPESLDFLTDDPWPASQMTGEGAERAGGESSAATLPVASPELAVARARWESARCELKLAEVEIVSNVASQASVQHDALSNDVIVSLQVGVALPITDRKRGLVQAARAQVAQAQAQYAAVERQVLTRVADAQGQYRQAQAMVAAIESELLDLARERLDLARQAQQQGEIDYLDLLTAQRSYLAIQQTAVDAQEQAALAHVRLQTLAVEDR